MKRILIKPNLRILSALLIVTMTLFAFICALAPRNAFADTMPEPEPPAVADEAVTPQGVTTYYYIGVPLNQLGEVYIDRYGGTAPVAGEVYPVEICFPKIQVSQHLLIEDGSCKSHEGKLVVVGNARIYASSRKACFLDNVQPHALKFADMEIKINESYYNALTSVSADALNSQIITVMSDRSGFVVNSRYNWWLGVSERDFSLIPEVFTSTIGNPDDLEAPTYADSTKGFEFSLKAIGDWLVNSLFGEAITSADWAIKIVLWAVCALIVLGILALLIRFIRYIKRSFTG